MKKAILFTATIFLLRFAKAGEPQLNYKPMEWNNDIPGFVKGKMYISGGLGAFNFNYALASALKNSIAPNWNHITIESRPIWFAKGEYAIGAHSGIGFSFAHSGMNINVKMDSLISKDLPISGQLRYRSWSFLARYNYHLFINTKADLYFGAGIGYRNSKFSVTDNDPKADRWNFPVNLAVFKKIIPNYYSYPSLGLDLTVGFKYYILPPIALYAEIGLAKSFAQGGISVRF